MAGDSTLACVLVVLPLYVLLQPTPLPSDSASLTWVGLSYSHTPIVGRGLCSLLPDGPLVATAESSIQVPVEGRGPELEASGQLCISFCPVGTLPQADPGVLRGQGSTRSAGRGLPYQQGFLQLPGQCLPRSARLIE